MMEEHLPESDAVDAPADPEEQLEDVEQDEQDEQAPGEQEAELARLRERVGQLEEQIRQSELLSDRVREECSEFEQYFPDVPLRRVPDGVWEQVRQGVPLAAAYALYEKKQTDKKEAYRRRNEQSAARSAGMPEAAGKQYFSPAEVRAMSQHQVRENYDRIFESMRHWQ